MCRFNYIMIKEDSADELLEQEEYIKTYDDLYGFRAYERGCCNCGSFVGSLINRKGMTYHDAIETNRKEKLERLYKIKNIMTQPGYRERKDNFLQTSMKFSEELLRFTEHINNYEEQQTDLIDKEYSGEAYNSQMDKLHKEVSDMLTLVETQSDYVKKSEDYSNFFHENELLNESTIYYLTKEEEEQELFLHSDPIHLEELLELDLEPVVVENIEIPSNTIDEVISRTEKETFTENLDEYNAYYKLFSSILKHVSSFMFCTVWIGPNELKNVKTVGIESLTIDDMAFLDYDEMICITK